MPTVVDAPPFTEILHASTSVPDLLARALTTEMHLRRLFAEGKDVPPFANLIDVFLAPPSIRASRTFPDDPRVLFNAPTGDMSQDRIVPTLEAFCLNFDIFTAGMLSKIGWSNVVAAGGSVLASLTPLPEYVQHSKELIENHYREQHKASDVDLFLWGLTAGEAESKMEQIYDAVSAANSFGTVCVRQQHTVTIYSQHPLRPIQLVLRLYRSPAEILAGFDVDAPCCAYDGKRVWATPRAMIAIVTRTNTVDLSRRSPSYEVRLAKYASRGYQVFVPELDRSKVNWEKLYNGELAQYPNGLARLLVLEKIWAAKNHFKYLHFGDQYPGSSKANQHLGFKRPSKGCGKGVLPARPPPNNYDSVYFRIPYQPGLNAESLMKRLERFDTFMNYNLGESSMLCSYTFGEQSLNDGTETDDENLRSLNQYLHRHPVFWGTMAQCITGPCICPPPRNKAEDEEQLENDKKYVRGHLKFIADNPGQQLSSGSFNPINDGEWMSEAH